MLKAVIFDLDGTLCETMPSLRATGKATLAALGYPDVSAEAFRQMIGYGADRLVQALLTTYEAFSEERFQEARRLYHAAFREHCCDGVYPYEGLLDILQFLQERGVRLACLTNKPEAEAQRVIASCYPAGLFQTVWGGREDRALKPDPRALLALTAELGAKPEEALMVGDGETDVETGKNAAMRTASVLWGYRERQLLETYHPDYLWAERSEMKRDLRHLLQA